MITEVEGQVMDGINMVEYNSESEEEISTQVAELTKLLDEEIAANKGVIGYQVTSDLASIGKLYAMRKKLWAY